MPDKQAIFNGCRHAPSSVLLCLLGGVHGQVQLPGEGSDALCSHFVRTYRPQKDLNFLLWRWQLLGELHCGYISNSVQPVT